MFLFSENLHFSPLYNLVALALVAHTLRPLARFGKPSYPGIQYRRVCLDETQSFWPHTQRSQLATHALTLTLTVSTAPSLTVMDSVLRWGDTSMFTRPKEALATHRVFKPRTSGELQWALRFHDTTRRRSGGKRGDCRKDRAIKGCGRNSFTSTGGADHGSGGGSRVAVVDATLGWTRRRLASHGIVRHFFLVIGVRLCFHQRQC